MMRVGDVDQEWRRFKLNQDMGARDRLIQHYAYLVKITSGRLFSTLPVTIEREDLVSAGILGLIKAVDLFDMSRQVKFETYAIARIRGAILEMLREDDWVPRSVRERMKELRRIYSELENQFGRPATDEEVIAALGVDEEEFHRLLVTVGRSALISLEDFVVGDDGAERHQMADALRDTSAPPTGAAELHERRRILSRAIDRLPERERTIIALYYYEGMTFKEVGRILSISESRVFQLHTQAVLRLHGYLQRDADLFQN